MIKNQTQYINFMDVTDMVKKLVLLVELIIELKKTMGYIYREHLKKEIRLKILHLMEKKLI